MVAQPLDDKPTHALADLGALYHNYAFFGVNNEQREGIFAGNQRAKEPILRAYIAYAIAKCPDTASFLEMFCADGYYAMVARKLGATPAVGLDNNRDGHFANAVAIAARLKLDSMEFVEGDVYALHKLGGFDIIANVGGLYHVAHPRYLLEKSYQQARRFLIVQSVVSMASNSEDYFVSPAPGWDWGSRMSRQSFHKMVMDTGWKVIDHHFNELHANPRIEDRGSVYYLIDTQHT